MDLKRLRKDEGFRGKPYRCSAGKLTIGYGRNLEDNPLSKAEAEFLLLRDVEGCVKDLRKVFDRWEALPVEVKEVLVNMRYQLGAAGFRKFKNFIAAVRAGDFPEAAEQMKDSLWYRQVTARAKRLIKIMKGVTYGMDSKSGIKYPRCGRS